MEDGEWQKAGGGKQAEARTAAVDKRLLPPPACSLQKMLSATVMVSPGEMVKRSVPGFLAMRLALTL